ncbi:MAG: hypothetical protein HQK77_16200 [Desulfobacterales bacterium]|nr:hypothetical protein [Desulfobacterales bacterium]
MRTEENRQGKDKKSYSESCPKERNKMILKIDPILSEKSVFQDDDLVCYCFEYTKRNIVDDYRTNGYSKILERIKSEKKNKGCKCEVKNPKGK